MKIRLSTTQIILLSFLAAIMVGAILLSLPISAANGQATPFVDALFTATTATCVTGLVVVPTVLHWSVFGQVVILLLIQIGGLGIITVMAGLTLLLHRKLGLADSVLIQDAFNLNSLSKLGAFVKKVILGTFLIEGVGALLYMTVFIPEFGLKGIWIAVFNAISAFCNAGIDILAEDSLAAYAGNPLINLVTCALIVLGGLGYIVWWDILRVYKEARHKKGGPLRYLTLHSKIALTSTVLLILGGAALFWVFEHDNPATMQGMSVYNQIQAAIFQSVTTRTAGFFTIPQEGLTNPSALISLLLMFIGGSPVGTAGGIKTVTFAVLLAAALAAIRNRNEVTLYRRCVPKEAVHKAIGVTCMSAAIAFLSTLSLSCVTDAPLLDVAYEAVSATATVGLSRALTPTLGTAGRLIIAATMYLGRIGPISLAVAFAFKKETENNIKNPTEDVRVG